MWEDNKTRSKWVFVNRCYFPNDLPEADGRPCSPESNENSQVTEAGSAPASNVDELLHKISIIQEDLRENEMLVEVIRARMKEADAKATDLKASFENLCESAKREIDAFEEEERELILIEDLHSKEVIQSSASGSIR